MDDFWGKVVAATVCSQFPVPLNPDQERRLREKARSRATGCCDGDELADVFASLDQARATIKRLEAQREVWYITKCPECREDALTDTNVGPCVFCGHEKGVTFVLDETPRNVRAQEETVRALWDFAGALGADPASTTGGVVTDKFAGAVGSALARVMESFGYVVTSIQ